MPSAVYANMIWPTFLTPFVALMLLPWIGVGILLSEVIVACMLNWSRTGWYKTALWIVAANIVSTLAGMVAGHFLGDIPGDLNDLGSPDVVMWMFVSFMVTFVLSILIEGAVLQLTKRWSNIARPYRTSLICNAVSYAGIAVAVYANFGH